MKRKKIKEISIVLFIDFELGKRFILLFTFLGIADTVITNHDLPRWWFWIASFIIILFCVAIGDVYRKRILKDEIKKRNPVTSEILETVKKLEKYNETSTIQK